MTYLCGDCWQEARPDSYAPEPEGDGPCTRCGQVGLLYNVAFDVFSEWCLHCGSYSCPRSSAHNTAYGRAS
jgi:hypothetical protein